MVSRRMKPAAALSLIRRRAREHNLTVRELPGRGKGSHRMFAIEDADRNEVARFGLAGHARDLSLTLLQQIEDGLAHLLCEGWTDR
ncbi:MAG: hypothetical protein ACRDOK_09100 [Streptosporangiaceae bacterium]